MDNSNEIAGPESEWFSVIGYNNMVLNGQDEFPCPPEPCDQDYEPESPPTCPQWNVPSVTKEGALEALRKFVSEQGLYLRPAEEAVITNMETFHSYRYRLETFTEKRFTRWNVQPYKGEVIDNSGHRPQPWDIPVEEPVYFQTESKDIPVPFTSLVKDCGRCLGKGKYSCAHCKNGRVECYNCDGVGTTARYDYTMTRQSSFCYICSGEGTEDCLDCCGTGEITCPDCMEHKKTTVSITLRVKWTNNQDSRQVSCDKSVLNNPHMQQMPGQLLLTDSGRRVHPLTNFPEPTVVQASERLVQKHREKFSQTSRILQQRQTVELMVLTKVTYEWRQKPYVFYINGTDGGAIVEDYPQPSCECCTVM